MKKIFNVRIEGTSKMSVGIEYNVPKIYKFSKLKCENTSRKKLIAREFEFINVFHIVK